MRHDVQLVNELSAELTPLDIQLSSTASRQLDQLNMRWKLLQVLQIITCRRCSAAVCHTHRVMSSYCVLELL